ncbi:MAG: hypothetical protein Q8P86_02670 [bacterium]|nr:hypothetical protein [bacterium]
MKKIIVYTFIAITLATSIFSPFSAGEAVAQGVGQGIVDAVTSVANVAIPLTNFVPQGSPCLPTPSSWDTKKCIASVVTMTSELVMSVAGLFLWASGQILDLSISHTVNFSAFLEKVPVVDIGWTIFRDIANIIFIFILLYISISTILGLSGGSTKRMLATLVISALLINFSLFISKAVIDAANIMTIHFYDRILSADPDTGEPSFSASFMEGLKLSTLYKTQDIGRVSSEDALERIGDNPADKTLNFGNILIITAGGTILILVTAFTFLATALMFLGRAVALIFLMILSPLAFAVLVLPGLSGKSRQWWDLLIKQSFFAPAFMALAYVVASAIHSDAFRNFLYDASYVAAFTSGAKMEILLSFIVLTMLMYGCLIVAQQIGGKTAEFGMKVADMAKNKIAGGAGWAAGRGFTRLLREGGLGLPGVRYNSETGKMNILGIGRGGDSKTLGFKWHGGEKNRALSTRELNDKMQESAFWKGNITSALRESTVGKLVNTKFAGRSTEEAFQRDQRLAGERYKIEERSDAINQINAGSDEMNTAKEELKKNEMVKTAENTKSVNQRSVQKIRDAEKAIENAKDKMEKAEEKVASALTRLSGKEFVKFMPEDLLSDPKIMQRATSAQIDALMEDNEKYVNQGDKEKMLAARHNRLVGRKENVDTAKIEAKYNNIDTAQKIINSQKLLPKASRNAQVIEGAEKVIKNARKEISNLQDGMGFVQKYEMETAAWQKSMEKWEEDIKAWKSAGGTEENKPQVPPRPSMYAIDKKLFDDMRAMSSSEMDHLFFGLNKEELMKNVGVMQMLRGGQIQDIMKSSKYTREQKDGLRELKFQTHQDAIDMAYGIKLSLPKEERKKMRKLLIKDDDERFRMRWQDIEATLKDKLKEDGKSQPEIDAEIEAAKLRHGAHESMMREANDGKTDGELAEMAEKKINTNPFAVRTFGPGVIKKFVGNMDRGDLKDPLKAIMWEYEKEKTDPTGKYLMTEESFQTLKRMVKEKEYAPLLTTLEGEVLPNGTPVEMPDENTIRNFEATHKGKRTANVIRGRQGGTGGGQPPPQGQGAGATPRGGQNPQPPGPTTGTTTTGNAGTP